MVATENTISENGLSMRQHISFGTNGNNDNKAE